MLSWIWNNKEWLFSGLGITLLSLIFYFLRRKRVHPSVIQQQTGKAGSQNIQAGHDVNISLTTLSQALEEPEEQAFGRIYQTMVKLIAEMKKDLRADSATKFVREFAILPSRKVSFNTHKLRFVYYEDEHLNLRGKIDVLENHGFVNKVTFPDNNTPIYRMTEEFVKLVLKT